MIQSLQRQLRKLDQELGIGAFEASTRLLLPKLHWNVEASMPILMRHQRELAPRMGDGRWPGAIDPDGYDRIHRLVPPEVRDAPPSSPEEAADSPADLDDRKRRAINALIDHYNQHKVAELAGVSRLTIWRWLQQPSFLQALADAQRQAYDQSFGVLDRAVPEMIGILTKIVRDTTVPTRTRMRSGFSLVSLGETLLDQVTLEAQIAKMEEALNLGENPPCNTETPVPIPEEPTTPSPSEESPAPPEPGETSCSVTKRSTDDEEVSFEFHPTPMKAFIERRRRLGLSLHLEEDEEKNT